MQVVYLDTLFFLNLFADYYLLMLTARLCGVFRKRRYVFLGAAVGAVIAILLYFPKMPPAVSIPVQCAACAAVTTAAFGIRKRRELLRLCTCFAGLSFLAAGVVFACSLWRGSGVSVRNGTIYFDVNAAVTLLGFGVTYLLSMVLVSRGRLRAGRSVKTAVVKQGGKSCSFRALCDSGNLLRDPADGRAVLLVSSDLADSLFSEACGELIAAFYRTQEGETLADLRRKSGVAFRLVPMRTAAGSCLILAFLPEKLFLDGKETGDYLIGIAPERISPDGDCKGLIGVSE